MTKYSLFFSQRGLWVMSIMTWVSFDCQVKWDCENTHSLTYNRIHETARDNIIDVKFFSDLSRLSVYGDSVWTPFSSDFGEHAGWVWTVKERAEFHIKRKGKIWMFPRHIKSYSYYYS